MTRGHSDWDVLHEQGFESIDPPEGDPEDDLVFASYARPPVLYKVHISDAEETLPGGQIVDTTMSGARYTLWRDGEFVQIFDDAIDVLGFVQDETGYTPEQMRFNAKVTRADAKEEPQVSLRCPECAAETVRVISYPDLDPPHFLSCDSCGHEEWWTEEQMDNAMAMLRDLERLVAPIRAEAWRRWAAGDDPADIRRDLYPDDPDAG